MGAEHDEPPLRLVAAPLTEWPASLLLRLRQRRAIELCDMEAADGGSAEATATAAPLLLGYSDPGTALAAALATQGRPDIPALLDDWRRVCGRMLALRRRWPDRALLIDPSRLEPAAEAALLRRLDFQPQGPEGDGEASVLGTALEVPPGPAPPPSPLPAVVAHYLAQRSDLAQLFADLEGNAELLGREPQLGPPAPVLRGLVLAERLLAEWQTDRTHLLRQGEEGRALAQRIEALGEELAEARRETEQERARRQDSEEERELILLQLQQVQEELTHTFQEYSQVRQECGEVRERGEEAGRRLAILEQECRTLFRNSRLDPGIDRTRIATILQLMRDSLQV
jgi:hypothetical protein